MNISGINPHLGEMFSVNSAERPTSSVNNHNGVSFVRSMLEVASSANMQIANGSGAASLAFNLQKEEFLEPFDFSKAEEEMVESYIARIENLLKQLKK